MSDTPSRSGSLGLSAQHVSELRLAFDAFDDERLGHLSIHTATILCRALGFPTNPGELARNIQSLVSMRDTTGTHPKVAAPRQERLTHGHWNEVEEFDSSVVVDFDTICQLLQDKVSVRTAVPMSVSSSI